MLCFNSALFLVKGLLLFLFSFLTGSDENFAQTGKPGNTFIIYLAACVVIYVVRKIGSTFFYVTIVTVTLVNSRHFVTSQMVSPRNDV